MQQRDLETHSGYLNPAGQSIDVNEMLKGIPDHVFNTCTFQGQLVWRRKSRKALCVIQRYTVGLATVQLGGGARLARHPKLKI